MSAPRARPAADGDVARVAALAAARPFTARWSEASLRYELGREDSVFLVLEGGALLGYALARLVDDEARLVDFASAADRSGAGAALWRALGDEARRRGAKRITLEVSERNAAARAFYANAGARETGRRRRFYPDGSDALLLDAPL